MSTPPLHYRTYGSGAQTIVLLHGFLASGRYWQDCATSLSQHYTVVAVDLLGFGASPKPRRNPYGYAQHISAIRHTLQAAGVQRPYVLAGHSMGALLALRLAALYPQYVRMLMLFNPPLLANAGEARQTYHGDSLVYRLGLTAVVHRLVWPLYRFGTHARLLGSSLSQETEPFKEYLFQHTAVSRYRSFNQLIVHSRALQDLADLHRPALIVHGSHDRAVYRRNAAGLTGSAHVSSIVVPGDHHLPLRQPEMCAELISDHLADVSASGH